jgi:hypothetical protein
MRKSGSKPFAANADWREDAPRGWDAPECQLVLRWFAAINACDLEAMLDCLSPAVTFQPLRLNGIERTYNGHDGVIRWHQRLIRLQPDYWMRVDEMTIPLQVTVLAIGSLSVEGLDGGTPFWGVHTIEDGTIVTARHCLGDAELAHRFGTP